MKIRVFRKDKDTPLPVKKTQKSAGLDIYSPVDVELKPGIPVVVPTGLIVEAPEGYFYKLFVRSGLSIKNNVSLLNDVGIVDGDYCGPEDEIKVGLIRHHSSDPSEDEKVVRIKKGERFAQMIFEKIAIPDMEWDEQESADFAGKTRGGFGSTGQF